MRFVYDLTVPANTLESAPASEDIMLVKGKLTRVQVRFLRGCHNQVSVVMCDGLTRIVPVADSTELNGDGQTWDIPMNYGFDEKAPEVTIEGWSPDTDYDHVITWYIDLQPDTKDERSLIEMLFSQAAKIGDV